MPIYEYQCPKCGEVKELWQSMYDTDVRECPECAVPMQKLISRSSFQLKGGGWYADGYCKKGAETSSKKKNEEAVGCSKGDSGEKPGCAACSS